MPSSSLVMLSSSAAQRPGGNVTGISLLSPELDGKRQQLLIEAVSDARRMGAMFDAKVTQSFHVQVLQQGARSRGVELAAFGEWTRGNCSCTFGSEGGGGAGH
jgi:putative ABC transport system substrate-binding protein